MWEDLEELVLHHDSELAACQGTLWRVGPGLLRRTVVPHTDPESTGQPGEKQGDGKSGPSKDEESGDCSYVEHREHDRRRPVDRTPFRYGELGTHYVQDSENI